MCYTFVKKSNYELELISEIPLSRSYEKGNKMTQTHLISVLMPVYNTKEEYLRVSIESILNQTFKDFEFIIVNDGSTNNAEEVILSYKDDRIKYFKQENQGIVVALNNAWAKASGKYFARMDSDDIAYPERFAKQVKFLEENLEYSLVGSWAKIIPSNNIIKLPQDIEVMDLLADCMFVHPSIMFRKADFEKFNICYESDFDYVEDYCFYARAIKCLKMTNLQEVFLDYRVYPENSSTKNRDVRIKNSFRVQDLILESLSGDKKLQEKILDLAYLKKRKKSKFAESIFSVKNLYKNWTKYKLVTVLGMEILLKVREYKSE